MVMVTRRIDWLQPRFLNWLLLFLIILHFFVSGWSYLLANNNSNAGDQGVILQFGLDLREHGVLSDGLRPPLYPAIIAPFAQRAWSYFTWAKIISLLFGAAVLVLLFVFGRNLGQPTGTVLAALLLSINSEYLYHSASALVEALFVFNVLAAWYYMDQGLTKLQEYRSWLLAGIFSALAYLTKTNGSILLVFGAIVAVIFYRRRLTEIILPLGISGLAFILVASPFFIYNYRTFGNPFYNYVSHAFWMDNWRQSWVVDESLLPTFSTYMATHTPQDVWTRFLEGAQELWLPFWQTLIPLPVKFLEKIIFSPWNWLGLLAVVSLPVIGYRTHLTEYLHKWGRGLLLIVLLTIFFFLSFAWYTRTTIGTRFFLPLLPILYFFLGSSFWFLFTRLAQFVEQQTNKNTIPRLRISSLLESGFLLLLAGWLLWTTWPQLNHLRNPFLVDIENNADTEQVLAWLTIGEPQGATVVWGPGHSLPTWKYSDRLDIRILPANLESFAEMSDYFSQINADYIILDELMVRRYKERFKGFVDYRSGRLELLQPIPNWSLAYAYKSYPCDWCVFIPQQQLQVKSPPAAELNEQIQLLGYRLINSTLSPGQTLLVWFYWQSLGPVDKDYTIFAHLVGPNGLQGQVDRPPLNNLWPTSRWFPQQPLADRFDISLSKDAPPGNYQIYVGMYDPASGQRLSMRQQGQAVTDNAFVINGISVSQ